MSLTNKSQAIDLLRQISSVCQLLTVSGCYTKPICFGQTENVELRLLTTLDHEARREISSIIAGRGLRMVEADRLVIIFEPLQATVP